MQEWVKEGSTCKSCEVAIFLGYFVASTRFLTCNSVWDEVTHFYSWADRLSGSIVGAGRFHCHVLSGYPSVHNRHRIGNHLGFSARADG